MNARIAAVSIAALIAVTGLTGCTPAEDDECQALALTSVAFLAKPGPAAPPAKPAPARPAPAVKPAGKPAPAKTGSKPVKPIKIDLDDDCE